MDHDKLRYFEDFRPGEVVELGSATVAREDVLAFARRYDPQPFHVDEEAAGRSPYGGLIASGFHTAALFMRLFVDGLLAGTASLGSPGLEDLRWTLPVRPGDTLHARYTVLEARPSRSDPGRGILRGSGEAFNQHDDLVMAFTVTNFVARRPE